MTAATAWRVTVPSDILPLVFTVTIGGSVAGFLAEMPLLFFTSAVMAAAIAAAATFGPRTPESNPVAAEALAQLPDGQARALLADLLQRAAAVPAVAHAGPLVSAACEAARQLSALEVHLAAFEGHPHEGKMRDAFERCQRGSALLAQRLQDASAALSRWQAAQGIGVGESLGELARELNDESRYQQEAAREVEALLS
jgi:hypothetical protein